MILDLIAILFIIILSFCLCMNEQIKNTITNCQISHILIGLSVIIFYKLAKYFKLTDKDYKNTTKNTNNNRIESFSDTTSISKNINDFISGATNNIPSASQLTNLTPEQLTAYSTQLNNLTSQISQLNTALSSPTPISSPDASDLSSLDIAAQQQYQLFQINYLNKQIQNSQDIINAQTISNLSTNYKPIKVFSSCVISNADGSTTIEKPVNSSNQVISSNFSNISSTPTNADIIINNANSQSTSTSNDLLLSPNTGIFNNLISQYLN